MSSSDLSKRIANLSPEKRAELLKKLAAQKLATGNTGRGLLMARDRSQPAALSFAQQRLWFIDQLEPGSPLYNVPVAVRLEGALDVAVLERSLLEVVRRHGALRTTFHGGDTGPVQHFLDTPVLELERVDVSEGDAAEREAQAWRRVEAGALRPFDLAKGPLMRGLLVRLGEREHLLLVSMHHIVSDGWSLGVLVREVAVLYDAFAQGQPSPLPELAVQYADFAAWQRDSLQGALLDKQLGYWREQLQGAPPALELTTDKPRPATRSFRGARHPFQWSRGLSDALKALGQQEGATLFMVLLAGWQTLLSRYSGQDDVSVGSPMAGRTRSELEGLIGMFVNTLVLRTRFQADPSFQALLHQVRETQVGATDHQDLPFERLVEALQPDRDLGRSPFFQVMFALQNAPRGPVAVQGMKLHAMEVDTHTSKFDLLLQLAETEQGLRGYLEYDTDLFHAATLARMEEHLRVLLDGVAAHPEVPVSRLPLMGDAERQQLVVDWNRTAAEYPREESVHARFAAQARRTPEVVALKQAQGGRTLTYGVLDARANQLAHHLRGLGVKRGTRVGVYVERSFEMVVGLLAILKAGGAYVPVDRNYPAERIALLLEDAGVEVTLTQQPLLEKLPAGAGAPLCVDTAWEQLARHPETAPDVEVDGDDLAYVIFTSGSTGRPKGVCIPHRGITRLVLGNDFMRFGADEVWSQLAPVAFDASTLEVWGALLHGAKLVLAPPHTLALDEVGALLKQEGITALWLTAALYEQMALHQAEALALTSQVLTGGDVLPVQRLREHVARLKPGMVLVAAYGPTENTTFSTTHALRQGSELEASVPIGRPIGNSSAYVLDAHGALTGIGIPGELYVGGEGIAWGYLNRPELTAERFVPHGFSTEPGARLYRTGDKARWKEDGTLEFLGRTDFQVKVRGFRIELGEVEAALTLHASVAEAVVVVRVVGADKQLVGYVVAKAGAPLDAMELKAHLRQRLPEYMVPAVFMVLDALPVSANGKVDRRALPQPEAPRSEQEYEAPRTEVEAKLAAIWAEVLRVPRLGVHDNFFEMGGHSLLATQVVSRVRTELGAELPLRALFEAPTVEALARRLEQASRPNLLAMEATEGEHARPLSFAQQRLWFIDQLEPGSPLYHVPLAVRLEGVLEVPALQSALDEVLRRHEALRTTFNVRDGAPVQVVHPPSAMSLETVDLRGFDAGLREDEARRQVMAQGVRPFDLAQGPLVRAQLLRLDERDHLLAITMHHIVSDGWSLGVLVREVGAMYAAFVQGQTPALPELPVQYPDYAAWQRGWLQGDTLEREVDYWKQRLAGAPPVLELPTDWPRPAVRGQAGAMHFFHWSPALTRSLKALAQREGASLYMVLLAGWQVLLSRYSGQTDLSVGSPIAGRTRSELEGLIGFFVNTLVLRAQVEGDRSFRALLKQVRGTVLEAYEHQEVPFEKLVEVLQPDRSLSHSPLFQTLLTLQNVPQGDLRLPGMTLKPVLLESRTAKFDLSLFFVEEDEGLRGTLEYSTDLFKAVTVRRMVEHLRVLLEGALSRPEEAVTRLPMSDAQEREQVLKAWNQTAAEYPREAPVHARFAAHARRTPELVALKQAQDGRTLTYGVLDARANQLAHHLRGLGVKRGTRVGVYVERSFEMVVGLLAILKAGGAYVPVDRNYPAERIALLLEDAGVEVTLTQQPLLERLPESAGRRLCLDTVWEQLARHPETAPDVEVGGDDLAYVMFTSGSTGRPKGVCIPHRGITRLVLGNDFMRFGAEEVWLQLAPVAFDASTLEVWGALLHGAKLVLAPPHALTLDEVGALLKQEGITALWLTAAFYEQMALNQAEALSLTRQVLSGGDVLPVQRMREHVARLKPGMVLVAGYGPTENTTFSTTHALRQGSTLESSVPIGRPIGNSTAFVLDAHGDAVGVAVPGELYVGGEGLAWGYLNRPDLTAERFVPHGFGTEPGARLYRTGDKARWREDGTLEFLGRTDFQVKVRGFRIELGEVEAALTLHASVAEAAVVVRDVGGDKRLVAWLVAKPGQELDPKAVEAALRQRLPEYMVPSAIGVLDALPLSANGKVDRKALPALDVPREGAHYEAPRTKTEERLSAIWADVLRVPRVGVKDDFFALGGHSLLATQVASRLRSELGVELPLRTLFEARTLEALAQRIEEAAVSSTKGPRPVRGDAPRPLSFAQQRLWFIDQLEPGTALYNVPVAVRLEGTLRQEVLEQALHEIVRRHAALRTTFAEENAQAIQVIHPNTVLPLELEELQGLGKTQREEAARRQLAQEMLKPFDLKQGPLVRARLWKLDVQEHVLVITMHHIVSDGWSVGVLVREVSALYAAFAQGRPSPLPELPVQYADYAAWQRQELQGETLRREVDYWKRQLVGAPPVLELPTDRPRPAVRGNAGESYRFRWSHALEQGLRGLGQREGASLYMVLLAGWQTLMARYSGQPDISVGSPIAGRTRSEVEGLIGFFVNTLVLRAQVDGAWSFRKLLGQVRETVLGAYEHQEVPFEKLVEALQPERSLSHTPLFQTMLAVQNMPMEEARLPGLVLKPVELSSGTSKFDVSVFFTETPQGLSGVVEYSTELFEAGTIRRMVEHLRVLMEGALAKPEEAVGRLPMLTEAERQQVLVTFNQTQAEYPRDATIPQLFEAQVRKTPEAIAVVSGKQRLTYREVEAKANQLAHRLRKLGVGPESRVGLCVERTADVVVGTLGILKAGGAYVPLDPSYPKERLGWLLEDAQGPALVAHSHLLESLPAFSAQAVCLDTDATLATESDRAPDIQVQPENVAYFIYTSGSTGRPKGVAVTHRNAVAFLTWAQETFEEEETKAVLAATSLNFDLSVFELFAPLVRGGSVVVVRNALHLAEEKVEAEVTLINTVPSAMAQLVRLGAVPPSVRVVNLAGEALPETLAKQVYGVPTVRKLYNLYGPSEDTTYSTWSLVGREEVPNIGRPLTNTRAYVLDTYLQPVPVGVAGELYLAGEGQARGYLLRPELTAEKFLPEVHGPAGSRMYRTGDRVRYRADGVLEYLGRVDFQVKVRGFRIELGEVEAALRQQEAVKDAVVVAKGEGGEKRLVAYVAAKPGATLEAEWLKASLRQRLPEYMVPGTVVVLEALPLNANGKVDRKALPEPEAPQAGSTYEAPRTELEAKLAAIWSDVLRIPQVGVKDDFFALGGHSLLATQVASRVRTEMGAELPLRALFEAPTVEGLAQRLEKTSGSNTVKLERAARENARPLSFAQQRLWFIDQLEPGTSLYNVPVAVRLEGELRQEVLQKALREVMRRHEALRTTFAEENGQPIQVIHAEADLPLDVVELQGLEASRREEEARHQLGQELLKPFDLHAGPLVRARLLKLDEQEHILAITMHHIVSDGWSQGVLVREVSTLYSAFAEGRPSPLPELPVQYADYATWQRSRLQGETLQREVDYWKQQLVGAPPVLELPTDRPRPAVRGNAGAVQSFRWPQVLEQGLRDLARREGASLYMVLLAGWQALMARYSGQPDISVGSPIAGRTRSEVEGLIGFFVNTLVLRADLSRGPGFRELLGQVRETVLGAYEHQEVPFEKLVEALQPERSLSHTPLFQTMLAVQNMPMEEAKLPGLVLKPVELSSGTSKFDVSVFFTEMPQGLSGAVEYSTELFEAGTIRRMVEHLRVLMEGVVAKPEEAVGRLPMLTEAERQQVLVTWNQTQAEYPRDATIPQLFEAQARMTPDAVAVISGKQRLTYREVEAKANQLAHRLRTLGVGPESRVGLCVERTADVVVGTMGILKAGGAYLPLDPSYPKERLGWLLEDAQGPALVAHSHLLESLPAFTAQAVCLDRDEALAEEPISPVSVEVQPENAAYLIYTSGSTGRPKGVAVTHRNAVAFLTWAQETFEEEET
ncbi:non-ribosomal peptide synthetase, partial [Corallococcus llansteffanensis]